MVKRRPVVFVALSGGVDSAVAAYLLQQQGYDVRGVFMKNWTGTHQNLAGECSWIRERNDAHAVAQRLKIPFAVWDFEREYRELVIDHFFREYARGRTPNPDVRCNQYVKIPLFLERALAEGAGYIATGHYVRKSKARNQKPAPATWKLLAGTDTAKDQSYFLYTLTQEQLERTLFPVGAMTKAEVRSLAATARLPVAQKPDSQGICFVGEVKVVDFLRTRLPDKPGPIVDTRGTRRGEHRGLHLYTLGQREGLGLSGGPWYAVGRRRRSNTLVVCRRHEQQLIMARTCTTEAPHWVAGSPPWLPATFVVRHRYRHPLCRAHVSRRGRGLSIAFAARQRAVTPGQVAVLYRRGGGGYEVVGGATIARVEGRSLFW